MCSGCKLTQHQMRGADVEASVIVGGGGMSQDKFILLRHCHCVAFNVSRGHKRGVTHGIDTGCSSLNLQSHLPTFPLL